MTVVDIDRGPGLNNGVKDAHSLVSMLRQFQLGERTLEDAMRSYDQEMLERGAAEVELSKQQTEADHDWKRLGRDSPIMRYGGNRVER